MDAIHVITFAFVIYSVLLHYYMPFVCLQVVTVFSIIYTDFYYLIIARAG